jgi:hypothetical protein
MSRGQTINSETYIQILKTLQKHFTRVQPDKNVARILGSDDNITEEVKSGCEYTIQTGTLVIVSY